MKNRISTEMFIRDTELPEATKTYTVIPHGYIIDTIREKITENNFVIESESYSADNNGRVAFGSFIIKSDADAEMAMSFNFANSYDKSLRFNCSIGGYVYDIASQFISHELETDWKRKHTGTAYDEVHEVIDNMIACANDHFEEMLGMKEAFKKTPISHKQIAQVAGILYFDKQAILGEQAAIFKKEFTIPSYDYKEINNLWYFYKLMMVAIRGTTITQWVKQQMKISMYMRISKEWLLTDASPVSEMVAATAKSSVKIDSQVDTEEQPETYDIVDGETDTFIGTINTNGTEARVETDQEYLERVAEIEGDREDEDELPVWTNGDEEVIEVDEVIEEFQELVEEEETPEEVVQEKATTFKINLAPKKEVKETKASSEESFTKERIEAIKEETGFEDKANQFEIPEDEDNLFEEELFNDLEFVDDDDTFEEESEEVDALLETTEVVEEPVKEARLIPEDMEEKVKMISEIQYPNGVSFKASTDRKTYLELITTADEVLVVEK